MGARSRREPQGAFSWTPVAPIRAAMSASPKVRPIYSTLADDPAAEESIQDFVVSLADHIDGLQDADGRGLLDEVCVQARELVAEATARGFDSLARCAEVLEARCAEEDAEGAHKQLVELTTIAHRIRLGHRGAM